MVRTQRQGERMRGRSQKEKPGTKKVLVGYTAIVQPVRPSGGIPHCSSRMCGIYLGPLVSAVWNHIHHMILIQEVLANHAINDTSSEYLHKCVSV